MKAKPHPMKMIDWKAVSTNSVLSKQFSPAVFNKFQSLSTTEVNENNVEAVYDTLINGPPVTLLTPGPPVTGGGHGAPPPLNKKLNN